MDDFSLWRSELCSDKACHSSLSCTQFPAIFFIAVIFLTLDLIRSAVIANLWRGKVKMFSLLDHSNVHKHGVSKEETQQTHKGHAYRPHIMLTLKQEANCCNCLYLLINPLLCLARVYVLKGTYYTPPFFLAHIHTSTPSVNPPPPPKKKGRGVAGGGGGGWGGVLT